MTSRTTRTAVALLCATAVAVLPATPAHADQVRNNQWHLRYLKVAEAHKISQGAGVTVAVIDTGVNPHSDLRNNLLPGTVTYAGGSGDGRQDGDPSGHGTGIAGLIAAHGRGSNGALGIAPRAKILPIRDTKQKKGVKPDEAAAAIEWATSNDADIINISASIPSTPRLQKALDAAMRADIVVVAAAGNRPEDFLMQYPAIMNGVVAVGATDSDGRRASSSVTGNRMVISAPGVDIESTATGGRYSKTSGTSNSTAIVAGAVALVRSKFPDLSAEEVVHRLTATAVDKGAPGRDEEYGYGVVDLVAALTADVPPLEGDASATPSPAGSQPDSNAAPNPEDKSSSGSTILIGVLIALVVLGLLVTLLVVQLVRRRQQPGRH